MNKRIYRSRDNKMLSGVCGGIGEYFDIDPTIVRLVTVLIMLPSMFMSLILYLICAAIIPIEPIRTRDDSDDEIIVETRKEI